MKKVPPVFRSVLCALPLFSFLFLISIPQMAEAGGSSRGYFYFGTGYGPGTGFYTGYHGKRNYRGGRYNSYGRKLYINPGFGHGQSHQPQLHGGHSHSYGHGHSYHSGFSYGGKKHYYRKNSRHRIYSVRPHKKPNNQRR